MTIFCFANILGLLLIAMGIGMCFLQEKHQVNVYQMLRSNTLGMVVFLVACVWFLLKIANLGEADFGQYKHWLLLLFGFAFAGCCVYWKDFLVVRGIAMLSLMSIQKLLGIGYMSEAFVHPFISLFFYVWIVIFMYIGVYPYCARNILPVIFRKNCRYIKYIGLIFTLYGISLIILAQV